MQVIIKAREKIAQTEQSLNHAAVLLDVIENNTGELDLMRVTQLAAMVAHFLEHASDTNRSASSNLMTTDIVNAVMWFVDHAFTQLAEDLERDGCDPDETHYSVSSVEIDFKRILKAMLRDRLKPDLPF